MSPRLVLNYLLPGEYYDDYHQSCPMAQQSSSGSTNSSGSSASSEYTYYETPPVTRLRPSGDLHQPQRHANHGASTTAASLHPSYGTSCSQNYQEPVSPLPKARGDKSGRDSRELQYCLHEDCLDERGQPIKHFTRKADVGRHYKSTHDKCFIDCPKHKCNRKGNNGFTRFDHLNEHLRGYHGEPVPKRQNNNTSRVRSKDWESNLDEFDVR